MRVWSYLGALALGGITSWACATDTGASDCPVGSVNCECTQGGGCDLEFSCVDGFCKDIDAGGTADDGDDGNPDAGDDTPATSNPTTGDDDPTTGSPGTTMTVEDDDGSGDGIKLDVGADDLPTGTCSETGCRQIDLLFAVDGTGSMIEEIQALAATQAFTQVVDALAEINCGDIEYRIGLTNDNDAGFLGAGANGNPWFDSTEMTQMEIANAFNAATAGLSNGTPIGCEHVLTSATNLLAGDTTGFVRDEALLVVVPITDVDDHGYYDQVGFGGFCDGFLCTQTPTPVTDLYDTLIGIKGGDSEALATIVVAGNPDPLMQAGSNSCGQPASCCGVGLGECAGAHFAPRLWDFASMMVGNNGVTLNICDGAAQIPTALQSALGTEIDLACQEFEPEG